MSSKTKATATKGEAARTLVPKLRFPEFRGAESWEQTALDRCLDYQQPTPYLVADTQYSPAFKTPVLTAGKTFILGYTDEPHGIFSEGLPVIIFDDFTTATQFVDFPFKAKSSAMKILQAKNGANIKFIYETLQTLTYEVGAHERHWISNFAPMLVPVPKPAEQQKIAECLSSVDELMAAQARKVHLLKTHKKGLMQQLFPREGETQPRLRFAEFRSVGAWKPRTLGSVCRSFSGGTPSTSKPEYYGGDIPFIRSAEIARDKTELFLTREGLANSAAKRITKGDVLVALYGANSGDVALAKIDGAINQAILCLKSKASNVFIHQFLSFKKDWIVATYLQGGQGNLSGEIVKSIAIGVPSPPEQQRIASCLSSLDALITANTQKLEALKTHKKGLMQQLFPYSGEVEA